MLTSFKKVKIFSIEISWNKICSDWAVKWLSLILKKSEHVSKICSSVSLSSHLMHTGGSSNFSKKGWVTKKQKKRPMHDQDITASSFLFVQRQTGQLFKFGNILWSLFSGNSSHSNCHTSNIYLFVRDKAMSSPKMLPVRASLATESAAECPLMPTWLGTQIKTISFPSLVNSIYNSINLY